jgi:quercetin dioxygenase-like cupin family protein
VVDEARLEQVDSGLAPVTEGWFVVNARDAAWVRNDYFSSVTIFEADDVVLQGRPDLEQQIFPQLGFTLRVGSPGKPFGFYHAESDQEDFLVLHGECILVIEDEERHLRAWDFVHCPPGTGHVFIGAGDGPCVLVAVGARTDASKTVYPRSEPALRHGARVETETTSGAYSGFGPWHLQHPERWDELPWS